MIERREQKLRAIFCNLKGNLVSDHVSKIPVLDLGPYLSGKEGELERLGEQVRNIQQTIGFWAVINHGVEWNLLENAYAHLARFFALSDTQKNQYRINDLSLGYIPPKSTTYVTSVINENTKKDLNETLILALDRPDDHPLVQAGTRFVGPNQWPEEIDGFKEALVAYQLEIKKLGQKLLPLFATALHLKPDYFDPFFDEPVMWSRNAHYPAVEPEENQFGIAPHSDHSFLTMLPVTDVPGLQIKTQSDQWIDARYIEKGILVNTGEFLNRWTNGLFIPTPHRVLPPETDRYSIATFFNPSPDTMSEPIPTCVSDETPARFDPVSMMDYVCWYVDSNYQRNAGGQQPTL